jgi:hypothetical protein
LIAGLCDAFTHARSETANNAEAKPAIRQSGYSEIITCWRKYKSGKTGFRRVFRRGDSGISAGTSIELPALQLLRLALGLPLFLFLV